MLGRIPGIGPTIEVIYGVVDVDIIDAHLSGKATSGAPFLLCHSEIWSYVCVSCRVARDTGPVRGSPREGRVDRDSEGLVFGKRVQIRGRVSCAN